MISPADHQAMRIEHPENSDRGPLSLAVGSRSGLIGLMRSVRWQLGFACLFMAVAIWLSSGTLAVYSANTQSIELNNCGYTGNIDHSHHEAVYWMLKGLPIAYWGDSVALRRILYPLLAFPFFETFGYTVGGVIANVVFHALTLVGFARFLFLTVGRRGAIAGVWLLATWPGIFYWAGLPYGYAAIVPISVWGFILLYYLRRRRLTRSVGLACLGIGTLCQAYDLLAFLGVSALGLILIYNRRPAAAVLGVTGLALPSLVTMAILVYGFGVPTLSNSNSDIYGNILHGYLAVFQGTVDWGHWLNLLGDVPRTLVENFFDSSFIVLPLVALGLVALNVVWRVVPAHPVEIMLVGSILLVFFFNNLAPPYEGWQMRGVWIARLYQPLFIVLIFFTVRMVAAARLRSLAIQLAVAIPVLAAVGLDGSLALGGYVANWNMSSLVYYRFYRERPPSAYHDHLAIFGRRPLGFCVSGKTWPVEASLDERSGVPVWTMHTVPGISAGQSE